MAVNGGSSSIKFALFESVASLPQVLAGSIQGIGQAEASLIVKGVQPADNFTRPVAVADHATAIALLMEWMDQRIEPGTLAAVWHRVVHGGPTYREPRRITPRMIEDMRRFSAF